ncbi:hypothetical protein [Miltoncostaea oceani]|uniref:hypothetical protein n=1 Tax=Miltoncostaea oceani TaxID=2843216 RepID=UPI001C3D5837|nr:hypothetical protein [Miltoncostaea oceani]
MPLLSPLVRSLLRLTVASALVSAIALSLAPSASAYVYRGGASQATERVPTSFSGGFFGSTYYYYDVLRASANPRFPSPGDIRNNVCGDLFSRERVSPSLKEDCAKDIAAQTLSIPRNQVQFDRDNDICFPLAGAPSPCWTNSPRIIRSQLTNELHYSHYSENKVPTARSTIAWNVKVWRFNVQGANSIDRTPEPFFERRIDLNSAGDANTSQLAWWYGGAGAGQNAAQAPNGRGGYWWLPGRSAGPLGPGEPGSGAVPGACNSRFNAYRAAYPEIGLPGQLRTYLNASAKQHMCFWPSGVNATSGYAPQAIEFDRNQRRAGTQTGAESVALAWSFNRQGGAVNLDYKIQGQPGYVYMVLVNSVDNREELMGQYVKFFFADGWEPSESADCVDTTSAECSGITVRRSDVPRSDLRNPDVVLEGPDTSITGRPSDYSLSVQHPEEKLAPNQTIVVKKTRLSMSDPNEKTGVSDADRNQIFNQDYYGRAVTFNETLGGLTDPRTWQPLAAPEHTTARSGLGSSASIQDVLHRRDESGAFDGNAFISQDLPLSERGQRVSWLNPSDEPGAFASVFGEVQFDTAVRTVRMTSDPDPASAPQLPCAVNTPSGRYCVNQDGTLRAWAADGTNDGRLNLSPHWVGSHQLATAYQLHPVPGAFVLRLTTNKPDQVEHLSLYDRASENGSRRLRVSAQTEGEWALYFCRPGRWADARVYRGPANLASPETAFNRNPAETTLGDYGCRRDFWEWDYAPTPAVTDLNACRAAAPAWGAVRSWLNRDGVPQAADLRGQLPSESLRRCSYQNSNGYIQDGSWKSTDWTWRWDSTDTCYGNRPATATVRYPDSPPDGNGDRKPAPLPSAQGNRCANAHPSGPAAARNGHVDGYWFRGGYTYVWGDTCARNAPSIPATPSGYGDEGGYQAYSHNGRSGKFRAGDRSNTNRLFYENDGQTVSASTRPRCTFIDPSGYQWTGAFTRKAAEPGFAQVVARPGYDASAVGRGRLPSGEYAIVADFAPGAGADTTWRMDSWQYEPSGSSWNWSSNRWVGSDTVQTEILSLQPTR